MQSTQLQALPQDTLPLHHIRIQILGEIQGLRSVCQHGFSAVLRLHQVDEHVRRPARQADCGQHYDLLLQYKNLTRGQEADESKSPDTSTTATKQGHHCSYQRHCSCDQFVEGHSGQALDGYHEVHHQQSNISQQNSRGQRQTDGPEGS